MAGRAIALSTLMLKLVAGKRLIYRPLTGTSEVGSVSVRAAKGEGTPAGEKFCEILRQTSISERSDGPKTHGSGHG